MIRRLVVALALLALPALAQSPPRLTPLGPTQAPRPSAPELPAVQTPTPPPAGIQAQPLPSLTAPDPAFAPPAAPPSVVTPVPPPAAAPPATPQVTTPSTGTPIPGEWQSRGTAGSLPVFAPQTRRRFFMEPACDPPLSA